MNATIKTLPNALMDSEGKTNGLKNGRQLAEDRAEQIEEIKYKVEELKAKDSKLSNNKIADICGVSSAALSQVLSDKYTSKDSKIFAKIDMGLMRIADRQVSQGLKVFVETSVAKLVYLTADEILANRTEDAIGLVAGHVGVGKSTAAENYARDNSNAIYIKGTKGMSKSALFDNLYVQLGMGSFSGIAIATKAQRIHQKVYNTERVILFDEATRVPEQVIESLRDLADSAKIGLVFLGREKLYDMFSSNDGKFAEIASRILTWNDVIEHLTEEDVINITRSKMGEVSSDAMEMIWQCSEANARNLNHLLDKINNYKKNTGEDASPTIILQIFHQSCKPKSSLWRNKMPLEMA